MTLTKRVCVLLSGFLMLNLTACHHPAVRQDGATSTLNSAPDAASAQRYAFSGGENYQGKVQRNEEGEVINSLEAPADQTYYFAYDNSALRDEDKQAIKIQSDYLISHPSAKIRLEGNTDARGSREYNIALAWRRDQAVARVFEQEGVLPRQIEMVSYGKERPAVLGNNEDAWRLNRRVSLVYEAY